MGCMVHRLLVHPWFVGCSGKNSGMTDKREIYRDIACVRERERESESEQKREEDFVTKNFVTWGLWHKRV